MINKIKVKNLIAQLETCDEFEVTGDSPMLNGVEWTVEVTGEPNNQVCLITWYDVEGQEFSVILTEQSLSDANVNSNRIYCEDHTGNMIEIALWRRVGWPAEALLQHGDSLDTSAIETL